MLNTNTSHSTGLSLMQETCQTDSCVCVCQVCVDRSPLAGQILCCCGRYKVAVLWKWFETFSQTTIKLMRCERSRCSHTSVYVWYKPILQSLGATGNTAAPKNLLKQLHHTQKMTECHCNKYPNIKASSIYLRHFPLLLLLLLVVVFKKYINMFSVFKLA